MAFYIPFPYLILCVKCIYLTYFQHWIFVNRSSFKCHKNTCIMLANNRQSNCSTVIFEEIRCLRWVHYSPKVYPSCGINTATWLAQASWRCDKNSFSPNTWKHHWVKDNKANPYNKPLAHKSTIILTCTLVSSALLDILSTLIQRSNASWRDWKYTVM